MLKHQNFNIVLDTYLIHTYQTIQILYILPYFLQKYELATSLCLLNYPYDSKNLHKPSLEPLKEK